MLKNSINHGLAAFARALPMSARFTDVGASLSRSPSVVARPKREQSTLTSHLLLSKVRTHMGP